MVFFFFFEIAYYTILCDLENSRILRFGPFLYRMEIFPRKSLDLSEFFRWVYEIERIRVSE